MIYFVQAANGPVKIGYTGQVVASRLQSIQTGNPYRLTLLGSVEGDVAAEHAIHHAHADDRMEGEWFAWSSTLEAAIPLYLRGEFPEVAPVFASSRRGGVLASPAFWTRQVVKPLAGVAEVAKILDTTKIKVFQMRKFGGLPDPVALLAATPVWYVDQFMNGDAPVPVVELMGLSEVAQQLNIHKSALGRLRRQGRFASAAAHLSATPVWVGPLLA